jgi:hypothetical protein
MTLDRNNPPMIAVPRIIQLWLGNPPPFSVRKSYDDIANAMTSIARKIANVFSKHIENIFRVGDLRY